MFVGSDLYISVKNTFGRSAGVSYARAFILVFSILFDQVSAVNKFDFRFISNSAHNKWSSDAMVGTFSTRPIY